MKKAIALILALLCGNSRADKIPSGSYVAQVANEVTSRDEEGATCTFSVNKWIALEIHDDGTAEWTGSNSGIAGCAGQPPTASSCSTDAAVTLKESASGWLMESQITARRYVPPSSDGFVDLRCGRVVVVAARGVRPPSGCRLIGPHTSDVEDRLAAQLCADVPDFPELEKGALVIKKGILNIALDVMDTKPRLRLVPMKRIGDDHAAQPKFFCTTRPTANVCVRDAHECEKSWGTCAPSKTAFCFDEDFHHVRMSSCFPKTEECSSAHGSLPHGEVALSECAERR